MAKKKAADRGGLWVSPLERLFGVPDALDQLGVLRAVLVAHRLRCLEESLLVGRHELDPGGLQLGRGLADIGVPQLALLELRLARKLADEVLVGLRQLVPARL